MKKLKAWFERKGQEMVEEGRERQKGEINVAGILMMGIGMVFLAVGFIMYPIVVDACDSLLAWTCTANASISDATFTGFTSVTQIVPLLVLVAYVAAAVFSMYLGVKLMRGGGGSTRLDLGTLILLGISLIFVAIGLIILPVVLEAICVVYSYPTITSYTGLGPILLVTPLIVLISFIGGAVVAGYFGIKMTGGG